MPRAILAGKGRGSKELIELSHFKTDIVWAVAAVAPGRYHGMRFEVRRWELTGPRVFSGLRNPVTHTIDSTAGLEALGARIRAARTITIVTGAGVSAASGVPTFRGAGGLWRSFRAEDLATPEAFRRDPRLVWEWYDWRRSLIASCLPNPAHDVLARWTRRDGVTLITQNVDGLHERAGSRDVVRFHGSIWQLRCAAQCGAAPRRIADGVTVMSTQDSGDPRSNGFSDSRMRDQGFKRSGIRGFKDSRISDQ